MISVLYLGSPQTRQSLLRCLSPARRGVGESELEHGFSFTKFCASVKQGAFGLLS